MLHDRITLIDVHPPPRVCRDKNLPAKPRGSGIFAGRFSFGRAPVQPNYRETTEKIPRKYRKKKLPPKVTKHPNLAVNIEKSLHRRQCRNMKLPPKVTKHPNLAVNLEILLHRRQRRSILQTGQRAASPGVQPKPFRPPFVRLHFRALRSFGRAELLPERSKVGGYRLLFWGAVKLWAG